MAKSELIDKIREAFLSANNPIDGVVVEIDMFCEFAANWLAEKGVVGVGHAASGLALRFADGSEIGLIEQQHQTDSAQTVPVHISTVKATPRGGTLGETASHQITGR